MTETETPTTTGEIRLEIPAAPEYLRLARLAVADVGARAGWSYEDIDDLRIAVDELCYAIGAGAQHGRLTLSYRVTDDGVEVEGVGEETSPLAAPGELARAIIAAVVDEFDLDVDERRFRFTKRG
jgi:anti-sigma regulatory factor (Ser/Thr protein kinase)